MPGHLPPGDSLSRTMHAVLSAKSELLCLLLSNNGVLAHGIGLQSATARGSITVVAWPPAAALPPSPPPDLVQVRTAQRTL